MAGFTPSLSALVALVCAGCVARDADIAPPSLSAEGGRPPHIDSVSFKAQPYASDLVQPQIHYHAPNGDARLIRQEVVKSTGPAFKLEGGPIEATAAKQKAGAIYAKDLRCGPGAYRVEVHAYLVDRVGDHSNTVAYTIHCNGG